MDPRASTPAVIETTLRHAWQRASRLPLQQRKLVVQLALAHRCQGMRADEVLGHLQNIASARPAATTAYGETAQPDTSHELAAQIVAMCEKYFSTLVRAANDAQLVDALDQTLHSVSQTLSAALKQDKLTPRPLDKLVESAAKRIKQGDAALETAAEESFTRILAALDPQTLEATAGSKMKVGPFHKAALYDAVMEKYDQIRAYHDKGRLVRDFRAAYRNAVNKLEHDV